MVKDSTQCNCDGVAEGHIETTIGMTGNNKSLDSESLNIFILIEHEFSSAWRPGNSIISKIHTLHSQRRLSCFSRQPQQIGGTFSTNCSRGSSDNHP